MSEVATATRPRVSARLRLAASYAVFLVAAGFVVLFGCYVVLRYVPNYPLISANPHHTGGVPSRNEILAALLGASGVILLALAIIGFIGGWVLAGWILKPLRHINEAARIAATGRLDHRIRLSGRNDEFRQLADTFDHMLHRLHDAFVVQERFAANASHELRTPLAITATMLDVARRNPDGQDYPVLLERLHSTNNRAIGITDALLRLADTNAVTAVAEPVDLAEIVRETTAEHAGEADDAGITVTSNLAPATVFADPNLLAQVAANLVRNAIRHNEPGGQATVTSGRDATSSTGILRVENTGRVHSAETAARLTEPFQRAESRLATGGRAHGHGLGLALVSQVIAIHDGTLAISPREGGGLVIDAALPLAYGPRP